MDMDVILVRPIDSLSSNIVGFQSPRRDRLGGAFMSFEKKNLYLKSCLQEFANAYDVNNWEMNGFLTHVWHQYYGKMMLSLWIIVVFPCSITRILQSSVLNRYLESDLNQIWRFSKQKHMLCTCIQVLQDI